MKPLDQYEVWFFTGSQDLYGDDGASSGRARRGARSSDALDAASAIPVRIVVRPVLTSADSIATACREANAADALRRCDRLDAHVLAGPHVDRGSSGAPGAAAPPAHAVQPRSAVGRDRHGLHEPAPGGPRRPRVRVHRDPARGRPQDGRRPLAGPARPVSHRDWARAACGWHEAHHLRVARFGDNMRNVADTEGDKVEAQIRLGVTVNGYPMSDLAEAIDAAPDDDVDDAPRRPTTPPTRSRPSSRRAAPVVRSFGRRPGSRSGCGHS